MPVTLSVGPERNLTIAADRSDFRVAQVASATQVFSIILAGAGTVTPVPFRLLRPTSPALVIIASAFEASN
jgi:hypothetical protein